RTWRRAALVGDASETSAPPLGSLKIESCCTSRDFPAHGRLGYVGRSPDRKSLPHKGIPTQTNLYRRRHAWQGRTEPREPIDATALSADFGYAIGITPALNEESGAA